MLKLLRHTTRSPIIRASRLKPLFSAHRYYAINQTKAEQLTEIQKLATTFVDSINPDDTNAVNPPQFHERAKQIVEDIKKNKDEYDPFQAATFLQAFSIYTSNINPTQEDTMLALDCFIVASRLAERAIAANPTEEVFKLSLELAMLQATPSDTKKSIFEQFMKYYNNGQFHNKEMMIYAVQVATLIGKHKDFMQIRQDYNKLPQDKSVFDTPFDTIMHNLAYANDMADYSSLGKVFDNNPHLMNVEQPTKDINFKEYSASAYGLKPVASKPTDDTFFFDGVEIPNFMRQGNIIKWMDPQHRITHTGLCTPGSTNEESMETITLKGYMIIPDLPKDTIEEFLRYYSDEINLKPSEDLDLDLVGEYKMRLESDVNLTYNHGNLYVGTASRRVTAYLHDQVYKSVEREYEMFIDIAGTEQARTPSDEESAKFRSEMMYGKRPFIEFIVVAVIAFIVFETMDVLKQSKNTIEESKKVTEKVSEQRKE
jgi:hypothetical protein